jgi:hypothetical protein
MKIVLEHHEKCSIEFALKDHLQDIFGMRLYIVFTWGNTESTDMQLWVTMVPRELTFQEVTCERLGKLDNKLNDFFGESVITPARSKSASSDGAIRFMVEFKREFEPVLEFISDLKG